MSDFEIRPASHDDMDFVAKLSPPGDQRPTSTAENSAILMAVGSDGRRLGYIRLCPEKDGSSEEPHRYVMRLAVAYGTERNVRSSLLAEADAWLKKRRYRPVSMEVLSEDESGDVFEAGTITRTNPL